MGLLMLLAFGATGQAQSTAPTEYEVKAGCLYQFAKLIEWPEGTFENEKSPISIGILGRDPFGNALVRVTKGHDIDGREICIRRSSGHLSSQLLFVSATESRNSSLVLESTRGKPVVTISELEGFAEQGGMIEFYIEDNRVRFAINIDAVARSGITISPELLKLAKIVTEDDSEDDPEVQSEEQSTELPDKKSPEHPEDQSEDQSEGLSEK
jgi:hypothetical protein